ncbi:MAG: EAL domain-containing protein [Burkholderiaceae bacterium]
MLPELALLALVCFAGLCGWLAGRAYLGRRGKIPLSRSAAAIGPGAVLHRQETEQLAGIGAWVHDLRNNQLSWSAGSFRIFGHDPAGGPPRLSVFAAAIAGRDRELWRASLRQAVHERQEMKLEFRYRRPDGQPAWVRMVLQPTIERGKVRRMSGIVQDISAVRAMQRRLAASETKFRELTELSADWVWETDPQHRYIHLSDSIEAILGPWARDLLGRSPWDAPGRDFLTPDWATLHAVLENHQPVEGFEHSMISPTGDVLHLELRGRPRFDTNGDFTGYRGIGRNITRERQQRLLLELEREIAATIREAGATDQALGGVIGTLCRRLGWIGGLRLESGEDGLQLIERAGTPAFLKVGAALRSPLAVADDSPEQIALDSGRQVWLDQFDGQPVFAARYRCSLLGARAALVVPITERDDTPGSLLVLFSPIGFRDRDFLSQLSDILRRTLSLYLRRAQAEEQLRHASLHDPLTGLPNRANLLRTVERLLAADTPLALLYIDLDHYKAINDTLGHSAGDRALTEIAQRLRSAIRPEDIAARMGGDEFVVLIAGELPHERIESLAQGILAAIEKPLPLGDRPWFLSASIGVALAPSDAHDAELLIRHADNAMYEVKTEGRNDVRFFSGRISDERAEQLRLASELPLALEGGQLELHYQPTMAIGDRSVVGIEALLRWRHPELGLIGPARFLPVAEQSNMIRELGLWVLQQALADRCRLGIEPYPDIAVSVNVTARQLADDTLPARIEALLDDHGLPARLLRIELTERALLIEPERTAKLISKLRLLDVRVVIDNFGTGYASLSWLKQLPVDGLKIDRSFVENLASDRGNAAIVEAITTMASRLGLEAMAEGVESAAELRVLRQLNCNQVQGGLIADPMPIDEIADFLETLPALRQMHLAAVRRQA